MSSTDIYCVYLTLYYGNKMPGFYIGSSSVKNVENGYRGSVKSKRFKDIWKDELLKNPHLFDTFIIETFNTRDEALIAEKNYHIINNVIKDEKFINASLASPNGYFGSSKIVPWNKNKNKENNELINEISFKISNTLTGRTKEEYPYLQQMGEKISQNNKGKSKYTDEGYAKMAITLSNNKMTLTISEQLEVVDLKDNKKLTISEIVEKFKQYYPNISYGIILAAYNRHSTQRKNKLLIKNISDEIKDFILCLFFKSNKYTEIKKLVMNKFNIDISTGIIRRFCIKNSQIQ